MVKRNHFQHFLTVPIPILAACELVEIGLSEFRCRHVCLLRSPMRNKVIRFNVKRGIVRFVQFGNGSLPNWILNTHLSFKGSHGRVLLLCHGSACDRVAVHPHMRQGKMNELSELETHLRASSKIFIDEIRHVIQAQHAWPVS